MEIDLSGAGRRGEAHFDRKCPECEESIKNGDTVICTDDEEWVCENCGRDL